MSQQTDGGFSVPAKESGGGIEDGDTITGTITGTSTDEWDSDDGPVLYYQISIDWDLENWERDVGFSIGPANDPDVNPNREIGELVQQFDFDLRSAIDNGEEVPLDGIFEPGTRVAFEVEEDTFEGDEGEDVDSFNIVKDSLRPAGDDAPEPSDSGPSDAPSPDDDNRTGQVLNLVEDAEESEDGGAPFDELRKTLLVEGDGKELWDTFQELTDAGDITITDDEVFVTN